MNYLNENIRRQDRLLDEPLAKLLLINGEYGVLSMINTDNNAYGIPISYVWDGKQSIYLHCATEGKKISAITKNNQVSFCVVGKTNIVPEKFTTEYESIILNCTAHINLSPEERMKGMEFLLDKYTPSQKTDGIQYARNLFNRTEIIRLTILSWSGKKRSI